MCDYSLHALQTRLAVEGEHLIVHRFRTGSIGLAAAPPPVDNPEGRPKIGFWRKFFQLEEKPSARCAVCIPPGAKLLLHGISRRLQKQTGSGETQEVTFTQLSAEPSTYRDAVRFHNGLTLLLQRLEPGQLVDVLSLAGEEDPIPVLNTTELVA